MVSETLAMSTSRKKIALFTIIAILISVSLLVVMEKQFPLKKVKALEEFFDERFYSQDFSKTENIVLMGTSHVAQANTTVINQEIVRQSSKNYTVYNLGMGADNPSKRVNEIDKIISMKPKAVFYGISYYDFPAAPEKDRLLIKITRTLSDLINNEEDFDNPQLFTRHYLFPTKDESKINPLYEDDCFSIPNTPFHKYCPKNRTPDTFDELKKLPNPIWPNDLAQERMIALSQIIEKFDKDDIKIVLFVTPVHKIYIDRLSDYQKNSFEDIIKHVSEKYGVKVYDFQYRYDDLSIWSDTSHIIETNGTVYDDDIAKMIIEEVE